MKLTPELIAQAPSALNPLKERQLDLRGESNFYLTHTYKSQMLTGHKIPAVENLGITKVLFPFDSNFYVL